jgi:DNA-binding MarR family transcriptional regulator
VLVLLSGRRAPAHLDDHDPAPESLARAEVLAAADAEAEHVPWRGCRSPAALRPPTLRPLRSRGPVTTPPDNRELAVDLIATSARLVRLAARSTESSTPRALARALAMLTDLGETRISDFAAADNVSQPTATNLLQRLAERGWIERWSDPADARAVRVTVTPDGAAALEVYRANAAEVLAPMLAGLDAEQLAALRRGVEITREAIATPRPGA